MSKTTALVVLLGQKMKFLQEKESIILIKIHKIMIILS